jgi:hypothetical protein
MSLWEPRARASARRALASRRLRSFGVVVTVCGALALGTPGAQAASTRHPKTLKQWSSAVCTDFARWQQQITTLASSGPVGSLLHGAGGPSDPDAIRLAIPQFLGSVLVATGGLARSVAAAGAPATKDGAAIAATVAAAVQFATGELSAFQTRAEQLGPNQPAAQFSESEDFPALLQQVSTTLPTAVSQASSAAPRSRVARAFQSQKACRGLL